MKKITANITTLIALVLLFSTASFAQSSSQLILKVDVPFEFNMGKKAFPAGSYEVVRIAPHMLALRDSKGASLATVVTGPIMTRKARSIPALRFEFDGDRHVLSQVWPASGTTGYELSVPKHVTYLAQRQPVEVEAAQAGKQ